MVFVGNYVVFVFVVLFDDVKLRSRVRSRLRLRLEIVGDSDLIGEILQSKGLVHSKGILSEGVGSEELGVHSSGMCDGVDHRSLFSSSSWL